MPEAKYLLVGSSHAALEALRAIRQHDRDGSIAMLTRDRHLPYSPTILPYVVSGRSPADGVAIRDAAFFEENACTFVPGAEAAVLNAEGREVRLAGGQVWRYERLLVATGAAPAIPPIEGLAAVPYHVLRTLDDATALRAALGGRRDAVVLGAGLVGLHAAETMAKAGLSVTVVDVQDRVLAGYFDSKASRRIEGVFAAHGVTLHLGRAVTKARPRDGGCVLQLDDGQALSADLLLVAAGVRPAVRWLEGSGIQVDRGVMVDEMMRTSVDGVWAAGDVAQALDFHSGKPALVGIVPTAVEQGRLAGMSMAGDPHAEPYAGAIPINTYRFFGKMALSVGRAADIDGVEVAEYDNGAYRRVVLSDNRLVGIASVDEPFDVGVMGELIRRRVDLTECRDAFIARPVETGRRLMSEQWR